MFRKISHFICRSGILFVIGASLSCVKTSEAFFLNSKMIQEGKDFFSLQKLSKDETALASFVQRCQNHPKKKCLKEIKFRYKKLKWRAFQPLFQEMAVQVAVANKLPLTELKFLDVSKFTKSQVKKILRAELKDKNKFINFTGKFKNDHVKSVLLSYPNLICNWPDKTVQKKLFNQLHEKDNFYELNFSKASCALEIDLKKYKELKSDLEDKNLKTSSFAFLQDRISSKSYKKSQKYKAKSFCKKLLKEEGFSQKRILENFFYKRKYDHFKCFQKLNLKERKKISSSAYPYILKSFLALGLNKEVVFFSDHLEYPLEDKASSWAEETLLLRASYFMRFKKWKSALGELQKMENHVKNLHLSSLYWGWVSAKELGKQNLVKEYREKILARYPLTYYGMHVMKDDGVESVRAFFFKGEGQELTAFYNDLDSYDKKLLGFYYASGMKKNFLNLFSKLKSRFNPIQKALFAFVLDKMDKPLEVIKLVEKTWEEDLNLRVHSLFKLSFPSRYQQEISKGLKKTSWMTEALVLSVIRQESAFQEHARSVSNAKGLMQLLPSTAREVARRMRFKKYRNSKQLFDSSVNILLGSKYMDRLIEASKGYTPYAFAAYNAGSGKMYSWTKEQERITDLRQDFNQESKRKRNFFPTQDVWIEELPWSETRFYVKALLRNQAIYTVLYKGAEAVVCWPLWACKVRASDGPKVKAKVAN